MHQFRIPAGRDALFRSAQEAEYTQRFYVQVRKESYIAWEDLGPNLGGLYPAGSNFFFQGSASAYFDFQITLQFYDSGTWQNSAVVHREFVEDMTSPNAIRQVYPIGQGVGTLIEFRGDDSGGGRDYNDLIVQVDLTSHFSGVPGLYPTPVPHPMGAPRPHGCYSDRNGRHCEAEP
jgi:hypothetical protein